MNLKKLVLSRMCYHSRDIIKLEDFDLDNILIDEKSHENVLIYDISCKNVIIVIKSALNIDKNHYYYIRYF